MDNPIMGFEIDFSSVKDVNLEQVFGNEKLSPKNMTAKLWEFVMSNKLAKKKE